MSHQSTTKSRSRFSNSESIFLSDIFIVCFCYAFDYQVVGSFGYLRVLNFVHLHLNVGFLLRHSILKFTNLVSIVVQTGCHLVDFGSKILDFSISLFFKRS